MRVAGHDLGSTGTIESAVRTSMVRGQPLPAAAIHGQPQLAPRSQALRMHQVRPPSTKAQTAWQGQRSDHLSITYVVIAKRIDVDNTQFLAT